MTKPQDPVAYNQDYFKIVSAIVDHNKELTVPMSYGEAIHTRQDFYNWRGALKKSDMQDEYRRSCGVMIQLMKEPNEKATLIFKARQVVAISDALAALDIPDLPDIKDPDPYEDFQ